MILLDHPSIREDFHGDDDTASIRFAVSASGFPDPATVEASGTVVDGNYGSVSTGFEVGVDGTQAYVTIVPYTGASGGGAAGDPLQIKSPAPPRNSLSSAHATLLPGQVDVAGTTISVFQVAIDYVPTSDAVKSLHVTDGTNNWDTDITPGVAGRYIPAVEYLPDYTNKTLTVTPYNAVGGSAGSGTAGPSVQLVLTDGQKTGSVGIRIHDSTDPSTPISADRGVIGAGLLLDGVDSNGRPIIRLDATWSTSAPSGTPRDGQLWFQY